MFKKAWSIGLIHGFNEAHAERVGSLANQLFDQLRPLHGMGPTERQWLHCAALLHDVGKSYSLSRHHKVARDIILESPDLPMSDSVRTIVAHIVRYHRGEMPRERHKLFHCLDDESKTYVTKLAALLRVADGLDPHVSVRVQTVSCWINHQTVDLWIHAEERIKLRKLKTKAKAFAKVYKRQIIPHSVCVGSHIEV
jgi:exopolyphosphatase / guanosine-5'-triphosphate,3'-diphosphate pyrophosphatase